MRARLIGRTGKSAGTDFSIQGEAWIGAAPDVELRMAMEGVSRRHARLWPRGESLWLEDNDSTNGTFVNGQRVDRVRLRHLDVVTLGRDLDLIFLQREGELPGARRQAIQRATLEWLEGPEVEVGSRVEIPSGTTTLGRDWSCTVNVDDTTVSKVHASIQRHADHVTLQDLKSTNGTKVNGHPVEGSRVLEDGDVIELASVARFRVSIDVDPDAVRSTPRRETAEPEVFDQEWKTRLIWSPGEMEGIERVHAGRGAEEPDEPDEPEEAEEPEEPEEPEEADESKPAEKSEPTSKSRKAGPAAKPEKAEPAAEAEQPEPAPEAAKAEVAPKPAKPEPAPKPDRAEAEAAPEATETDPATKVEGTPEGEPATEIEPAPKEASAAEVESATGVEPASRPESATEVEPSGETVPAGSRDSAPAPGAEESGDEVESAVTGVRLVGEGAGYALEAGRSVIGRSDECEVVLDGRGISRQHAAVEWTDEGVWVKDLGSVNGTRLNGELLEERRRLRHGDRLTFVDIELEVELEGEKA